MQVEHLGPLEVSVSAVTDSNVRFLQPQVRPLASLATDQKLGCFLHFDAGHELFHPNCCCPTVIAAVPWIAPAHTFSYMTCAPDAITYNTQVAINSQLRAVLVQLFIGCMSCSSECLHSAASTYACISSYCNASLQGNFCSVSIFNHRQLMR